MVSKSKGVIDKDPISSVRKGGHKVIQRCGMKGTIRNHTSHSHDDLFWRSLFASANRSALEPSLHCSSRLALSFSLGLVRCVFSLPLVQHVVAVYPSLARNLARAVSLPSNMMEQKKTLQKRVFGPGGVFLC